MSTLYIRPGFTYVDVDGNVCTVTEKHFDDFAIATATVDDEGYEHPAGKTFIVSGHDILHAIRCFNGEVFSDIVWEEE